LPAAGLLIAFAPHASRSTDTFAFARSLNEWADSQKYNNILARRYTEVGAGLDPALPEPELREARPPERNVVRRRVRCLGKTEFC